MMKKLALLIVLILFAIPVCAQTAESPLSVSVTLSSTEFSEPGPVEVSITVTNTSGADMPGPCALYGPDGERITEFGTPTLAGGESALWQGTWQVTQEHIDSGRIRIAVVHHVLKNGQLIMKQQPYEVLLRPATQPHVAVTLSNAIFTAPGPVDVTITVTNTSGADMPGPCALYAPDGMRITGFGTPTLAAGESATWQGTWQVTAGMLDEGCIRFALVTAGTNPDDPSALEYHHFAVSIIDLRDPLGLLMDVH